MVTVRNSHVPLSVSAVQGAVTSVSFGGLVCLSVEYPLMHYGFPGPALPFIALTWAMALLLFAPFIYDDDDVGSRAVTVKRRRIPFSPLRFFAWLRHEWRDWKFANRHVVAGSWWALWLVLVGLTPSGIDALASSVPLIGPYGWIGQILKGFLLVFAVVGVAVSFGSFMLVYLLKLLFSGGAAPQKA